MSDLFPGDYWPPVRELMADPLGHLSAVEARPADADPFPLDVLDGSLEVQFSEDWSPFAQVSLRVPAADLERVESLDPRKNSRLLVSAGYRYPDGRTELLPLADVVIRERPISRPADVVTLKASSDEALAQDYRIMWHAGFPRTGVTEAVSWLLGYALAPASPSLVSDFPGGHNPGSVAEIEGDVGDQAWSLLDDIAARSGTRIWCDETRTWRIQSRPESAGPTSLELTVGAGGTIITSESELSREDWANAVIMRYRWQDADRNEFTRIGRAQIVDGPYSVSAIGTKAHFEDIERPVSQASADAAARSRLRNLFSRGRSLSLTAGAAYWLRPGMTVRVQLPTGAAEKHLVRSVKFQPHQGLMHLVTRQPINAAISNGE